MKLYILYDDYDDDMEFLGSSCSLETIYLIASQRVKDTDGECALIVHEITEKGGEKYA